ncbi:hypothetical protein JVX92_04905 [Microbacterium hominis]|uniref:hypothetical protein n=1 Tax=Microbacterium hominis TaxID=162426 RepID=UPI001963CAF9|nr:hypothetical protein [Microbacterium hominis]QRY41602.1 hypothetical protein JVX92_04905 [Microbacterium hominis]
MRTYWLGVVGAATVGTALFIVVLSIYYGMFIGGNGFWENLRIAFVSGGALGLATSAFVILSTLPLAKRVTRGSGRVLFVVGGAVAPLVGWALVGVITGITATWTFFWGYLVIGVIASIGAGILCILLSFFFALEIDDEASPPELEGSLEDLLG